MNGRYQEDPREIIIFFTIIYISPGNRYPDTQ
jgi:hypothetical protein